MIRVMLSLDLKNATKAQRDDFDASLEEQGWLKLTQVDTVWCQRFGGITDDVEGYKSARNRLLSAVKKASAIGKIERVTYVAQISNREAIGRVVYKKGNAYEHDYYNPYPTQVE